MCLLRRRENAMARERLRMRRRIIICLILLAVLIVVGWLHYNKHLADTPLFSGCTASDSDSRTAVPSTGDEQPVSDSQPTLQADESGDENNGEIFAGFFSSCSGLFGGGVEGAGRQVSATDAVFDEWETQPDGESYTAMLREKYDSFAADLTELASLESTLSRCSSPEQVEANERFIQLRSSLNGWCAAVCSYPADSVTGDPAAQQHALAVSMAEKTRTYLDIYPQAVVGQYSDSEYADELLCSIMDDVVALYQLLEQ